MKNVSFILQKNPYGLFGQSSNLYMFLPMLLYVFLFMTVLVVSGCGFDLHFPGG